jgi:hypothetical protein
LQNHQSAQAVTCCESACFVVADRKAKGLRLI